METKNKLMVARRFGKERWVKMVKGSIANNRVINLHGDR